MAPAAVHDDRAHAHGVHEGHVGGEARQRLVVADGVAAVLDDHDLAPEPPDVRERLGQDGCLLLGGHDVVMFSST